MKRLRLRDRPLVCAVLAFAAGVTLAHIAGFLSPLWPSFAWTGTALYLCRRQGAGLLLLALSAGLFWRTGYEQAWIAPLRALDGQTKAVTLEITGFPQAAPYGYRVPVTLDGVKTMLFFSEDATHWRPGDAVVLEAKLSVYDRYGCLLKAAARTEAEHIRRSSVSLRYLPVYWAEEVRLRLDALFPWEPYLMKALLLGDKSGFSDAYTASLSNAGLSHIAAVSGLSVSFLVGLLTLLSGSTRRCFFIALPAIVIYVLMVGCPPSAVRAGIMQCLVLIAPLLRRDYDAYTGLAASLLFLLLQNPLAIADVGLQLSFSATLGILLFAGRWLSALQKKLPDRKSKLLPPLRFLAGTLCNTMAALVFTTPLCAYHFGKISLVAPLSNLVSMGAITLCFMGGIMLCLLSFPFWKLALFLAHGLYLPLSFFNGAVRFFSWLPFSAVLTDGPFLVAALLYGYALFLCVWLLPGTQKPRWWLAPASFAVVLGAAIWLSRPHPEELTIKALDVGQGQSILLSAGGEHMLIDCGGNQGNAGNIAADALASIGSHRLDLLVLTHYHADHAAGVPALLERVSLAKAVFPDIEGQDELTGLCAQKGVPVTLLGENAVIPFGPAEVTLYAPQNAPGGEQNELCMAALVTFGDFAFLCTGDMNAKSELWLLDANDLPPVEILVAGHHGSATATSAELLDHIGPQVSLISVGTNAYGHPTDAVLSRLAQAGADVYRTDLSGHINIRVGELP